MTEREHPHQPDSWTADEQIGTLRLWRDEPYSLRLTAFIQDEIYRQPRSEEIIALRQQQGVRTYLQAKPYVLVPDITLGVQLSPRPEPHGAIGEVAASTWEGMRHELVGQAQAWFYIEDRVIVLWEAFLLARYRASPNLLEDTNSLALWEGFERFLTDRFPQARQIVTTPADPEYEPAEAYRVFLRRLGYERLSERAFGKERRA